MAMKRKLNSDDVPEVVVPEAGDNQTATPAKATFDSLNLDSRILQAITREKFTEPTPVQAATLPLALSGKDILGMFVRTQKYCVHKLTPPSSRKDRLRQDSGLSFPNHPLHPPPQGHLNKTRKGRISAYPGSHKRACVPSHLHHQDLHNFLRPRSSRREPDPERGYRCHSRETAGTTRHCYCHSQPCEPMDQQRCAQGWRPFACGD